MRLIKTRCVIQSKTSNNKYFPKVLHVNTTESIPWSVPMARIEINTNTNINTTGYMSPIKNDDIIQLQADVRSTPSEKTVWQTIFEGRILTTKGTLNKLRNATTLICRGHGEELLYRAITADYSTSSARTGAILSSLVASYLTRLTDDSLIDSATSTVIPNFNIQQDTKYMSDIIHELESLEAYGYILKIITNYDSDGDLDTNIVSWQPVPVESKTVRIIESTPRLISADLEKSIENVVEDVTIYGAQGAPQMVGSSVDGSPTYGIRHHIGIDLSIATNQLCQDLAIATRSRFGSGITSGTCTILGDPNLSVGDLLHVKIPSIVLDGDSIDETFRVKRLSHTIDNQGWISELDLGELIQTPSDILAGVHTKNRLTAANFIE